MRECTVDTRNECIVDIIKLVARKEGVEPHELPPLYDTLDPDHLHKLTMTSQEPIEIKFTYYGYLISISDGKIVEATDKSDKNHREDD